MRMLYKGLYQPEFAIISRGDSEQSLKAGDTIIISDLVPAISGMLLSPQPDTEMANRLKQLIEGSKDKNSGDEQSKTNGLNVKGVQ